MCWSRATSFACLCLALPRSCRLRLLGGAALIHEQAIWRRVGVVHRVRATRGRLRLRMQVRVGIRRAWRRGGHHIVKPFDQRVLVLFDGWYLMHLLVLLLGALPLALVALVMLVVQSHG